MIFALDYDGTANRDLDLFYDIVKLIKKHGHTVYIVTMRSREECKSLDEMLVSLVNAVYFTNRVAKIDYMKNICKIDIWIDDCPWHILNDTF